MDTRPRKIAGPVLPGRKPPWWATTAARSANTSRESGHPDAPGPVFLDDVPFRGQVINRTGPSGMQRLILHIGSYKTGSSSIQASLTEQRERLRNEGIWYGATDRSPVPNLPKHTSLFRSLVNPEGDFDREKQAILDDFDRSGCDTLILSEESLCEPFYGKFERLVEFREHFEIMVICFLRRQDYFLESLWGQKSRDGTESRPITEYVVSAKAQRISGYLRKLAFWSTIGEVRALSYGANERGSVAAFTAATDLPEIPATRRANISPSMNCAALCNLLNRWHIPYSRKFIVRHFRQARRRHALGGKLRREILASHADRNAVLARRYGVVFDDSMPDEPEEPLIWPEFRALFSAVLQRRGHRTSSTRET